MDHLVSGRRIAVLSMLSVSMIPFLNNPAFAAGALPSGGNFVAGSGEISGTTSQLTVSQTTQRGIINWSGFSIGQGNSVKINNGSGATLNRVTGNSPSTIAGSLTSTGSTYVINQNGIVVTPSGKVLTGGSFVASTRDTSNAEFMAEQAPEFTGTSAGTVTNQGNITASNGDAVLIGKSASNSGSISAPNGTAGVVAGDDVLLQPLGSGLQIEVKTGSGDATNSGNIAAVQAVINAVGGNAYALAGNNRGIVRATGTKTVNGHVWLTAGGTAQVTGTVAAQNADGSGGSIDIQGSNINVSGTVNANAVAAKGDGGTITVGSKNVASTTVSGTLGARGGSSGGNGGSIETSGELLNTSGITVDTAAAKGKTGNWTLDPYNVTICDTDTCSSSATSNGAIASETFTPSGNDSVVFSGDLETALQTTNVTVTTGSGGSQAGDINVNSRFTWSANVLTLDAFHSINVLWPMSASGTAGLTIKTNDGGVGGTLNFNNSADHGIGGYSITFANTSEALTINGVSYTLLGSMSDVQAINGNLSGNYALAHNVYASSTSGWIPLGTDGAGNILNAGSGFAGTFEGLDNFIYNLTINLPSVNYVGLFGFSSGTIRNLTTSNWSVTGNNYVGGLVGYVQSGSISNTGTATVNGKDFVGGLVGYFQGGSISNSDGGGATGNNYVGGLVGYFQSGSISNSVSNNAIGNDFVGGLVGQGNGTISESFADDASGNQNVGGLVGQNNGIIRDSWGGAGVSGNQNVGGLVGQNNGAISNSYTTISGVSGGTNVGGLVGYNIGTINNAYVDATTNQAVVGSISGSNSVGGLVGYNDGGTISNVYATGSVSGVGTGSKYIGGLVGQSNGTISNAYATGPVSGTSYVGGLVGYYNPVNGGSLTASYATGIVSGSSNVGGLVGNTGGPITNSYWDTMTSGQPNTAQDPSVSGLGVPTPQLQGALPQGFDPTVWGTGTGFYPYLLWRFPTTPQFVSGTAYSDHGVTPLTSATVVLSANGPATPTGAAVTGANGYYYILLPSGEIPSTNGQVVVSYLPPPIDYFSCQTSDCVPGVANTLADDANGSVSGVDVYANTFRIMSGSGKPLSALINDFNSAIAFGCPSFGLTNGINFEIVSTTSITIDTPIASTGGAVVLAANTLGHGGYVDVEAPITTNGGNLIIGGGANPAMTAAAGTASHPNGVEVHGALDAGAGTITINGQGFAGASGSAIGIDVVAPISTSGASAIRLTGTGGGSGASNQNYGVNVANTITATGGGALTITGSGGDSGGSGSSNHGVLVSPGSGVTATTLLSGSGGVLSIIGTAGNSSGGGNSGIYTNAGISNSGAIILTADSMSIGASIDPPAATVTLEPLTPSLPVNVGGSFDPAPGSDLFISSAALGEIGANSLSIGRSGGGGTLTVIGNFVSPAPVLQLSDSTVNVTGGTVTNVLAGGDVTINADSLALTQTLNASSSIYLRTNTAGRPIAVGGSGDPSAGNDLFISSAALSEISGAQSVTIIGAFGGVGTLTVSGNIVAPAQLFRLADSSVEITGGSVTSAIGSIDIAADSVAINQPVSAANSATITIEPVTPSRPINVGGSSDPNTGNDLFVSSAALSQITLGKFGNLNVGTSSDTGTLTVVANTASPVSNLNLTDAAVAIAPDAILSNQNGTFVPNSNPPGSLTIQTDNFTIGTGAQIQATNASVSLFALSPGRPINVGGSADPDPGNDLFISAAALSQITVANAPGFGALSIGAPQGTGTLTVTTNVNSPVEILTLSDSTVSLAPGAVLSDSGTASDIGGPLTGIGVISDKFSLGSGAQIQAPGGLVVFAPLTNTLAVNAGGSIDPGNDLFLSTTDLNSVSAAQLFIRSVKGPLTVSGPLDGSPGGALEHITDVEFSSPNATGLIANPVTLSSSGALQLLSQNASFSQTAPITAGSLILGGPNLGGNYDLTNPANSFANLAVHRAGTADLVDSAPLNVTGIGVSAIGTAIPAGSTTITDTAAGGITVSGAVNMASGAPLTLNSYGGISVNAPVSLNDAPVTLGANIAGNGGYVDIQSAISTNGGNLVIGGGANPAATAAAGTASHPNGVEVNGALDAGAGAITINGQGFAGASDTAIGIDVAAPISTSGANALTLAGTGGGSGGSSQSYGVNVANVISATGSGAISITGVGGDAGGSGSSNHGVLVSAGSGVTATSLISGNTGALSITGSASNSSGGGNYGIYTTSKISNSGPITLSANSMHIGAGIDPPASSVTLQPLTPSLAVNVGDTSDPGNGLFLSTAELNEISANALVIGNANDTGPLTVTGALSTASAGALQNVSNLTLNSGSGQIAVNAPITVTGSNAFNLALNSSTSISYGPAGVISATGTGTLNAAVNGASAATTLSGANLAGANLNGDNLSGVNLSGSNLSNANLNKANLTNANLLNADLTGANFNNAVWTGATVSDSGTYTPPSLPAGTNWSGLNLSGMNLSGMNLTGYNLSGSNLSGAKLSGANLTGANLSGANLSGAVLFNTNLTNANLQKANLLGAVFQ